MIIHDHFDGSAHCVECGGICSLTGDDVLATHLIRYLFEEWAVSGRYPNYLITKAVKDTGIDFEKFKRRAKETNDN